LTIWIEIILIFITLLRDFLLFLEASGSLIHKIIKSDLVAGRSCITSLEKFSLNILKLEAAGQVKPVSELSNSEVARVVLVNLSKDLLNVELKLSS